jgi:hypothetical protein
MTPAQLAEARRWVALRGWRWMPGMVVISEHGRGSMRVCDVETLTEEDVARGQALAAALNAGALALPGSRRGAGYEHCGRVGDARGLVGIGHPIAYQEDEDGGMWPTFSKTSPARGWLPDLADPATAGCLLALAREITGRPHLVAEWAPTESAWKPCWWRGTLPMHAGIYAESETLALLAACEQHEAQA